jgi:hypothetical protein
MTSLRIPPRLKSRILEYTVIFHFFKKRIPTLNPDLNAEFAFSPDPDPGGQSNADPDPKHWLWVWQRLYRSALRFCRSLQGSSPVTNLINHISGLFNTQKHKL